MDKHYTKYLNDTFPSCQGHKKQGKTERLPKTGGDSGEVTAKHSRCRKIKGGVTEIYTAVLPGGAEGPLWAGGAPTTV